MTAGTEHDRELDSDLVSIIMPTYNCGAFIAETIAADPVRTAGDQQRCRHGP